MSLQLTTELKKHMLESKKKGLALGLGKMPEYVFTNEAGNLIELNNWRKRVFFKALEKAGIRRIRPHDIRHTYAGRFLKNRQSAPQSTCQHEPVRTNVGGILEYSKPLNCFR